MKTVNLFLLPNPQRGSGLGLSLSYDIVKAHGGEIKVLTKERQGLSVEQAGSELIIILPYQV